MDIICPYCRAFKFKNEPPGLCCSSGEIILTPVIDPPEPLQSLFIPCSLSKHFLENIRKCNACFQMTSFGASRIINDDGYMPTFKVMGQVYHRIGSLLPVAEEDSKFLQLYFIGNSEKKLDRRCAINDSMKRCIVSDLQTFFHEHNKLIKLFKYALDQMPSDDHQVFIRADRTPAGEHKRRFNAPSVEEIAVVIVGSEFERRDIIVQSCH